MSQNLLNNLSREPRKQSFSEKLESYISATASPNASRHLSFSSEVNNANAAAASEHNSIVNDPNVTANPSNFKNNWNPATAATFHPSYPMNELSFMQQQSIMMSSFPMGPPSHLPKQLPYSQMFPPFVPNWSFRYPSPNVMPNAAHSGSSK